MQRRLAALLAADVAGYSRLMGKDEVDTLTALKKCQEDVSVPASDIYGGEGKRHHSAATCQGGRN